MIEGAGHPQGTGFLVGADLLLTAAHVIDLLRWPAAPQPPRLRVFRLLHRGAGRSPAETGARVPVTQFLTAAPHRLRGGRHAKDWDAPAGNLDFALLKLGYRYRSRRARLLCPWTRRPTTSGEPGDADHAAPAWGVPGGHLAHARATAQRPRYADPVQGHTLQGSSGSPVIDIRGGCGAAPLLPGGQEPGRSFLNDRRRRSSAAELFSRPPRHSRAATPLVARRSTLS